jgi:hypothetical protein
VKETQINFYFFTLNKSCFRKHRKLFETLFELPANGWLIISICNQNFLSFLFCFHGHLQVFNKHMNLQKKSGIFLFSINVYWNCFLKLTFYLIAAHNKKKIILIYHFALVCGKLFFSSSWFQSLIIIIIASCK